MNGTLKMFTSTATHRAFITDFSTTIIIDNNFRSHTIIILYGGTTS